MKKLFILVLFILFSVYGNISADNVSIIFPKEDQVINGDLHLKWTGDKTKEYLVGFKKDQYSLDYLKIIPVYGIEITIESEELKFLPPKYIISIIQRQTNNRSLKNVEIASVAVRAGVLDTTKGIQYPKYQNGYNGGNLSENRGLWLYECKVSDIKEFSAKRNVFGSWSYSGAWAYNTKTSGSFHVGMKNYSSLNSSPYYERWRLWFKFDLSNLPKNARIIDAYLYVVNMNSHNWGLEEKGNPPNEETLATANSTPNSWTDCDSNTPISGASPCPSKADCINPYGTPGINQISLRTLCANGLFSTLKGWYDGSLTNNGIILNSLPLTDTKLSVPYFTYYGNKHKESYIDNISKNDIRLVVKLDTDPTEPVLHNILTDDIKPDSLTLKWDRSPDGDFESYRLFRSKEATVDNGSTMVANLKHQDTLSYKDSGLDDDTTYYYRLYVYDTRGYFTAGKVISSKTKNTPGSIYIEATSVTENEIKLKWTHEPESDFRDYKIYSSYSSNVTMYSTLVATISDAASKEYTDSGLSYNSNYYYKIFAFNQEGYFSESQVLTVTTMPPEPPKTVTLENPTEITYGSMKLKWSKSVDSDFGAYILYRDTVANFLIPDGYSYTTAVEVMRYYNIDSIEVEDISLSPETQYYYKVAVVDLTNVTSISNEVGGKTTKEPTETSVSLAQATDITKTSCKLSWTQSTDPRFSYYSLLRSDTYDMTSGNVVTLATIYNKEELTYSDTNLTSNYTYYYQIIMYKTTGEAKGSNIISVTALAPDPPSAVTLEEPSYDTGDIGGDAIRLKWNVVSDADFWYNRIYKSTSQNVSTSSELVATLTSKSITEYVITGLTDNTRYYFKIMTYNTQGRFVMSNEVSATTSSTGETPPDPVTMEPITEITYASMKLKWSKSTVDNFKYYLIHRGVTENFQISQATEIYREEDVEKIEYIDRTLQPETKYYFKVLVMTGNGTTSIPSNEVFAETSKESEATAVQLNPASDITISSAKLQWSMSSDPRFSSYTIRRGFSPDMSDAVVIKTISEIETITYEDTTLALNTTYYYQIRTNRTTGNPLDSNIIDVSTTAAGSPNAVILQELSYTSGDVGGQYVRLRWTPSRVNDGSFYSYRILKSTSPGVLSNDTNHVAAIYSQTVGSYIVTGLTPNIKYYFRVATYNMVGAFVLSNEVNVITTATGDIPPDAIILDQPSEVTYASMRLTWHPSSAQDFAAYILYRDTNPNFSLPGENGSTAIEVTRISDVNTLSYKDDKGMSENTTYYYKIVVLSQVNMKSPVSNEVYAKTTPEPPVTGVQLNPITDYGKTECTLTWTRSVDIKFSYYMVYRSFNYDMSSASPIKQINTIDTQTFTDTSCTINTTYYYQVLVYRDGGGYSSSNVSSVTTFAADPPSVPVLEQPTASDISYNRIRLRWQSVQDQDFKSYKIYRSTAADFSNPTLIVTINNKTVNAYVDIGQVGGISPGVTYYYSVYNVNKSDQAQASNIVSGTTLYRFMKSYYIKRIPGLKYEF